MTKYEVVAKIAEDKLIEKLIGRITKDNNENLNDLAQDLYMNLLEKDEEYILRLYNNNELKNFIAGMINNNYFSKTSRYYKNYRKYEMNKDKLEFDDGEEAYGES